LDRDLNANKNVLYEGSKLIGTELSDYTGGGSNKTFVRKYKPVKSESQSNQFCCGWVVHC